jgi:TrpR-related protein YerC/YecD
MSIDESITQSKETEDLFDAILTLKNRRECAQFFRDVCTLGEIKEMSSRFQVAQMLNVPKPKSYLDIAKEVNTSTATVTRVSHWLHHGMGGYHLVLKRLHR